MAMAFSMALCGCGSSGDVSKLNGNWECAPKDGMDEISFPVSFDTKTDKIMILSMISIDYKIVSSSADNVKINIKLPLDAIKQMGQTLPKDMPNNLSLDLKFTGSDTFNASLVDLPKELAKTTPETQNILTCKRQ